MSSVLPLTKNMSKVKEISFTLKAVINKQKTKVLFAEVDNDFADLLFSFLILPLGKIVYALDKHYGDRAPHVGSLNTLYHGLANLHTFTYQCYGRRPSFLNPGSAYAFPFLKQKYDSDHSDDIYRLEKAYFLVFRIFTQEKDSFIICDDLRIVPNGNGSMVQTLKHLGVDMTDIDGAETRNVTFGVNEIMDFLKGMLTSRQPLTDAILDRQSCMFPSVKYEPETSKYASESYNLKVVFQKSTRKLLFAQAEKDFVSSIATFLKIPVGLVDLHLGGNTCFNRIHNMYSNVVDLINAKHLEGSEKHLLMKPETFSTMDLDMVFSEIVNDEGLRMCMVTGDLTVTRLCLLSTLSLFNEMKISASDVEEVELNIGLEEVRYILKASLTSNHALSYGFNDPKFM